MAVVACYAALCLMIGPARAAPLEAYGKLPMIEDVAISGDGKRIAMTVTNGEERKVLIRDAASNAGIAMLTAGTTKLRDLQWADSDHLLVTYSVTGKIMEMSGPKREHFLTTIYEVSTNKSTPLVGKVSTAETLNVTIGRPVVRTIEGKPVILAFGVEFVDNTGRLSIFRSTPGSTKTNIVETGGPDTDDFLIDESGRAIARTDYDPKKAHWWISVRNGARWQPIAQGDHPFGSPNLLGPGATPGTLLVSVDSEEGDKVRELKIADGSWSQDLPYGENDALIHNGAGRIIGTVGLDGDEVRYSFRDKADQAVWNGIKKAYPKDVVRLVSWSDDHQKVVVRVESITEGPAYAFVDMSTKKASWIGNVYDAIDTTDISPVKAVAYKAADGLEITGYLTLPKGKPAKGLPLVVLPHGGPASRDVMGFDWWAQGLASQGYAVLQPNFRGSEGLGVKFLEAGYGEFGRKMQTDLSDGVRHLAAEGTIDPKRVCIVGASYGGYAALAGATIDTGVYRCASSYAGPADLKRMLLTAENNSGVSALRYWKNFMGVEGVRDPDLAAISPASQAAKVTIPVQLIHGKDDTVVLYEQTTLMAEAMKKAGKPVEVVTLSGEDHWLSRGATRKQMLEAIVTFLKKNNPPD
jgi:dipeptidyl aminopeptidase/acylaminoacyl peptidase